MWKVRFIVHEVGRTLRRGADREKVVIVPRMVGIFRMLRCTFDQLRLGN